MDQTVRNNQGGKGPCATTRKPARCRDCTIRADTVAGELTPEDLDQLDAIMHTKTYAPGETIYMEGDPTNVYYNIFEGVARLVKYFPDGRRAIVAFLMPGAFFGITTNGVYAYTAEAVGNVKMCCFPKEKIEPLFEKMPKLERSLVAKMVERLSTAHNRMGDIGRTSPRERVAVFLLEMGKEKLLQKGKDTFVIPMSREDISDYLGLTIETISRTLSAFARDGLIKIDQFKTITLLAPKDLRNLSHGA